MIDWERLAVAVISGPIGAAIAELIRRRFVRRRKRSLVESVFGSADVRSILADVGQRLEANRLLVAVAANGPGSISVDKSMTASIAEEWTNGVRPRIADFSGVTIGDYYKLILSRVASTRDLVAIRVDDLPAGSPLRDAWTSDKIRFGIIFHVHDKGSLRIVYGSATWQVEPGDLATVSDAIRGLQSRLRNSITEK